MARKPSTVVARAIIKALTSAGVDIARVEIDDTGKTVIVAGKSAGVLGVDDLDRELEEWESRHGEG